MAGGIVTAVLSFLTGKDGSQIQVTAANPLPVTVVSGGGGGGATAPATSKPFGQRVSLS